MRSRICNAVFSFDRYKNLIEARSGNSSPVNFGIGLELSNLQPTSQQLYNSQHASSNEKPSSMDVPYTHQTAKSNLEKTPVSQQQKPSREALLEIAPQSDTNLDSSHLPIFSSTLWKQQQQHSSSVAEFMSGSSGVIDTAKCIGVNSTGSQQYSSSASNNSSAQSHPFLLANLPSTSPLSESTTFVASSTHSPLHRTSSSNQSCDSSKLLCSTPTDSQHKIELQSHHSPTPTNPNKDKPYTTSSNTNANNCSPYSTSNSIDTFIKENEKFFHSGNKYSVDLLNQNSAYEIQLDGEENNEDNMKIQQNKLSSLTDDEKALLHEKLKVGLYNGTGDPKKRHQNTNSANGFEVMGESDPSPMKSNRRIILVSKPVPKPEPKPEPKYVNGKVVFGQLPVKPVLQKGSVAERVMLFEKCPEKTSVTKSKLNELQKNRISSPNKIGYWFKTTDKTVGYCLDRLIISRCPNTLD